MVDMTYLFRCYFDQQMFGLLNLLALLVGWWVPNLILTCAYWQNWWPHLKINPKPWTDLDNQLLKRSLVDNLLGLFIVSPLLSHFILYPFFAPALDHWPSLYGFLCDTLIMWLWADGSFYWLHRLFHHPRLYWIHKQHHKFHQTVGLASTYAHPLELIFVDALSTYGFLAFFRPNLWSFIIYLTMRYEESVEEHSGYDLPSPWRLLRSTRHHEHHHSKNTGAYGTFFWWDRLCGTDKAYLELAQSQ